MGMPLPVKRQTIDAEQKRREAVIKQLNAERRARLLADDPPSGTFEFADQHRRLISPENYK